MLHAHYDRTADIVWVRGPAYDPDTVIAKPVGSGLRETDRTTGALVGVEIWDASKALPAELLNSMQPPFSDGPGEVQ